MVILVWERLARKAMKKCWIERGLLGLVRVVGEEPGQIILRVLPLGLLGFQSLVLLWKIFAPAFLLSSGTFLAFP